MKQEGFLSPIVRRWRFQQCLRFLPKLARGSVLDVGCGSADLIQFLPPGVHYCGIERDETLVDQMRRKHPDHSFLVRDLEREPIGLGEATFQAIILLAFLEHLHKGEQVVVDLRAHLAADGRLIATTPTPWGHRVHRLGSYPRLFSREAAKEHCMMYDRSSLVGLFSRAGYEVVHYAAFELGLNQICVSRKNLSRLSP